jgi:epidermal growth factor receptor substrate 15
MSPPAYDKAVTPADKAHAEAQEFSGLIPSREIPKSMSSDHASGSTTTGQTPFGVPQVSSQPLPPSKVPFDNDFDDFEDLEDAKEGDPDDDFANISALDRSGLDDFNPMFDSPPQSKGTDHSTHGNGFNSSDGAFGDFTSSPGPTTATTAAVNDSHDWDAIFAGLDGPGTEAAAPPPAAETSKPLNNGTNAPPRPQVGRALTEAGVHDDPILKNLTSMGYPRGEALAALEKYDYNLERVSSHVM